MTGVIPDGGQRRRGIPADLVPVHAVGDDRPAELEPALPVGDAVRIAAQRPGQGPVPLAPCGVPPDVEDERPLDGIEPCEQILGRDGSVQGEPPSGAGAPGWRQSLDAGSAPDGASAASPVVKNLHLLPTGGKPVTNVPRRLATLAGIQ